MTEETLGDREAAGRITSTVAATLEQTLGPDWRTVTVEKGRDAVALAFNRNQSSIAATEAWQPFLNAIIRRMGAGETMSDTMVAAVVKELYGDNPTPEQLRPVLEAVENFYRVKRGEQPLQPR